MHKFGQNPVTVGSCSNNEVQRMNLTDSNDLAIQVVRNCGATTDYSTIILRQHKNDETLIAVYKGKPTVNFDMVAPNALLISTGSLQTSDKLLENSNDNNLTIKYTHHGKAINVTDGNRLIAANFNYGATGLAAGIPKEALLIISGWSQEASLLHKPEWGHWYDGAPYGDDPEGSKHIRAGMDYCLTKFLQQK
jgi:hypothetical protein